ncbi:sugar isomerase domain-containing protein [Frigoribacterium sp. CG_9.8]|uniref:sugar isomerase domain-containing protein n=1 Tax=Frigoribacterium sp. CG_9.8 TaxID=2787733 RepID=UPI0018CAD5A1|nr:SIS domain-containing protein [Frigoribacterium sp. CG_9.8]MBG6107389.1 putative phosphosugar-binding protein [Frigoribacterium sp. CG_9.8]
MTSLDGYKRYLAVVQSQLVDALADHVSVAVVTAAHLIADRIQDDRVIYAFGASHAGLLVQDQFYRAGGLVPIQPILPSSLMLNVTPITATSTLEQTRGIAQEILADVPIGKGDLLLIVSVSGRNAVPVEMCTLAQQRGATVVALTNITYSSSVKGRGVPRLFEVADVVIDLPGMAGDAVVALGEGVPPVGPTSSAVGAAILHGLMVETATVLIERGTIPPVFASANLDDSAAWNDRWIETYRERLNYL